MPEKIKRIMIVDGSSVSRTLLTRMLKEELTSTEVLGVDSAEAALAAMDEHSFDLITTALLLPDMDGLSLSRTIRDSNKHTYTPVIVVSGDADSRLLREGFEAGVTDYFDKSDGYKAFGIFIRSFMQRNSGLVGNILYVEDSKTAASVTIKMLEKQGLKVTHVTTAEEGLTILVSNEDNGINDFDLVITDFYLMGKMTGGDLLHAIRVKLHHSQQELPVLVLTSSDDEQTQVEVFHAGANDFVTKPLIEQVMIARVRALLLIKHQYNALKLQAETMRWIAATDSLTGVRSKRYLLDNGENYLRESQLPVWGILIDIDHFKHINDSLGHITGDHVLADLGVMLDSLFADDMVVRFGGEEFSILFREDDYENAVRRAEDLRAAIESLKPGGVDITVSIGMCCSDDHPNQPLSRFLSLADKALYFSKENGRNQVSVNTVEGPLQINAAALQSAS